MRILQARLLQYVAISFSRGSFWPMDRTHVSHIVGEFIIPETPGKTFPQLQKYKYQAFTELLNRVICQIYTLEDII